MRGKHHVGLWILAGVLCLPGSALAQKMQQAPDQQPQLLTVMPGGGQVGRTVEVTVSGLNLEDAQGLLFSQPGFKAELVAPPESPAADPKKGGKKPDAPKQRRNPNNPAVTSRQFKVVVPANAPLGIHDVRVLTKGGASNPRAFVVGDLPEVLEKEPNNDVPQAQRIEINTTVNGVISAPTDVDYFVFAGKKGQRVVVSCLASSIDSRLQPAVEVYDTAGKQLAFSKNYNGADALTDVTLPADGDYYVRLVEFTYTQGGPEYFYRLSVTTAPWIDAIYPPVIEPGKPGQVTVYGRNLPGGTLDPTAVVDGRALEKMTVWVTAPDDPKALQRLAYTGHVAPNATGLDGFEYRLRNASGASNPYLLTYARAPIVLDNENNDTPETAQEVQVPCEIAGRIEKKGDRDWYVFTAKKGDVYRIEVFGDRLGSPLDMYFVLRNAATKGGQVEMDDNPDLMDPIQFFTRTDDPPAYRFVAAQDGKYQLLVASREASVQAGPRQLYRVRITPEQPDFRLVLMPQAPSSPDACILRQGGRQYFTVFVWRLDGMDGAIRLTAEGLPPGVTCPPQIVGPGAREATLVVSAANDAKEWAGPITVTGTATIDGKEMVREARAATITWPAPQQNVPTISRMDRSLVLAVRADKPPFTITAGVEQVKGHPGEKVTIPVKVKRLASDFKAPLQLTVLNSPTPDANRGRRNRNNQQGMTVAPGKDEASVVVDLKGNVPPGTYTIVVRADGQPQNRGGRQQTNTSLVQVSGPITLTVEPRQLAKIAVTPETPTVKAGQQTEVVVKLTRASGFQGKIRLQLVADKGMGLSADEVVIPADKNEAKVVLKASGKASPGQKAEVLMRATGTGRDGTAVTQEVKLAVKVVK